MSSSSGEEDQHIQEDDGDEEYEDMLSEEEHEDMLSEKDMDDSSDDEDAVCENKILPIGKSSVLWNYFGFPSNLEHGIVSHSEVVCNTCQWFTKMNTPCVIGLMREHLLMCHPDTFAEMSICKEQLMPLSKIPSSPLSRNRQLLKYDNFDRDVDDPSDKEEGPSKVMAFLHGCSDSDGSEDPDPGNKLSKFRDCFMFCVRTLRPNYFEENKRGSSHMHPMLYVNLMEEFEPAVRRLAHDNGPWEEEILEGVPERQRKVKAKLVPKLEKLPEYSLSVESWNGNWTVSINFLEGPVLRNSILVTYSKYNGESLDEKCTLIQNLENEWGLDKEKIVAVVASMDLVEDPEFGWEKQLQVPLIPCFLDFLDKLVQDKLFEMEPVSEVVSENVYSRQGMKFFAFHKREGYWDTYGRKLKHLLTNYNQWEMHPNKSGYKMMKQLSAVLDTLLIVLDTFRREHPYGMVSTLWPILNMMLHELFVPKEDDESFLKELKKVVVDFTTETYSKVMPFLQASTQLDPRFRSVHKCKDSAEEVDKVLDKAVTSLQNSAINQKIKKPKFDMKATFDTELTNFLESTPSDFLLCPIKWWLQDSVQAQYPLLRDIAKRFTCIPSSCIPQKRILNDTIFEEREKLDNEWKDALLFLWSNHRILKQVDTLKANTKK